MGKTMETCTKQYVAPEPGEEVVITGVAGRFPECDNMRVLERKLMDKVDLVTSDDRRWTQDYKEIPHWMGKVNGISKFDATFFGVPAQQADAMEPILRILLEHTYEAIVDAGVHPKLLRGTETAVIVGCCFVDGEKTLMYEKMQPRGLGLTGGCRSMISNRIAYWLGVHGPVYNVDTACSSSLVALEQAYNLIRSGRCEAAIVAAGNLCLHQKLSLQFTRLGVLSADGRCKTCDAEANGYVRSEALSVVFLQKAKAARRIYATIVHGLTNFDGFKEQGITFPSSKMQSTLFKECYEECGLSPNVLSYVELHGTGTKVGDLEEVNAVDRAFCKNRTTPLKIGSIKSNLGHTEASSGLTSIAKIIIVMESGMIPPNLHYKRPREGLKSLKEGRLQVVTEPTPWDGGYIGVNSFGYGGVNCHVVLKSNPKIKYNNGAPKDDLLRLVVASGRTEEAVVTILNDIGLVDLLTHIGIVPDNLIGHSVGELGCAYADGCLTAEQTIIAAYTRGLASIESDLIYGAMVAVGRGYKQMKDICPPELDVACHNSANSCTISGPANSIKKLVVQLQENNIFAKEVHTNNIAYHSRYIAPAGPKLLQYLKEVIPEPVPRSAKWVSSSVPQSEWSSSLAKFSSAEYHTNNLLSPVLFEEATALIPSDAITIEIAPHGLLQAILKRSMPPTVKNISLTLRNHKDNTEVLLQALGVLYNAGIQLQLAKLYPPVEYPVSRGTPMISPLIKWDHSDEWSMQFHNKQFKLGSGEREVTISLHNEALGFLTGHIVDGRNIMPATAYLVLIWETFSMINGHTYTDIPVVIEDIRLHHTIVLRNDDDVVLLIAIQQGTGLFEITENSVPIVTGKIHQISDLSQEKIPNEMLQMYSSLDEDVDISKWMTKNDIYKELTLRSYQYNALFCGLNRASINGAKGHIAWVDNWVTFMDNVLQLTLLTHDTRDLVVPIAIKKIIIDPKHHESCISIADDGSKRKLNHLYCLLDSDTENITLN
ncbi:hypothetical protein KM043_017900 [Ampulex compressa]|nr:hypothetical protein KM043_017900 [Ampulex compressa]